MHPRPHGARDFHGETCCNETLESTTDPEARLYRKGKVREGKPCFMGHAPMESRNGLVVAGALSRAGGTAERAAALAMLGRHCPYGRRITLGADKAYDVTSFVDDLRAHKVTPHIAINGHPTRPASGTRPRSTAARHVTPALPSSSAAASASRTCSGGSKSRPGRPRPASGGGDG